MCVCACACACVCVCVCVCHCSGGQTKVSESEETTELAVVLPKAPSSHESPSFLHDPIAMYVNYNCVILVVSRARFF